MVETKTYIIHCKKLIDRKKHMLEQMLSNEFTNYEFYEEYDADELNENFIKDIYNTDVNMQKYKMKLWSSGGTARILRREEVSLTYKFYKVFEKIAFGQDESAIIFEDDVILSSDFESSFKMYCTELPSDYDAVFFGSGANLHIQTEDQKHCYKKSHPATRCADSFMITKKACQQLVKTYLPFSLCSDWEIAWQMARHNQNIYWFEPSLVKQGSETGLFQSTLR